MVTRFAFALALPIVALARSAAAQCPDWTADLATASPDSYIAASTTFDDGSGPALYVGGAFTHIGGIAAAGMARWDGSHWSSVGSGLNGVTLCFETFDDGSGLKLYAGGRSNPTGGTSRGYVARLDGSSWTTVGDFPADDDGYAGVYALAVFDEGSGPRLYAGGFFEGTVVRWNMPGWSIVGGGFENDGLQNEPHIRTMCVHDDGQGAGPALYVGGSLRFLSDWSTVSTNIARYSGGAWHSVGGGLGALYTNEVIALHVHDDGAGPILYVGGNFQTGIARWNGTSLSIPGGGMSGSVAIVTALASTDGSGAPRLVAGGRFPTAGGQAASNIAAFDGTSWSAIGSGITGIPSSWTGTYVTTFSKFDQGTGRGPDLVAAGGFLQAGGIATQNIAVLESCGGAASEFCYGDGSAAACPCGNASAIGSRAGCLHSLGYGGTLRVHGRAQITDDTLVLEGASMPGSSAALYFQASGLVNGGAGVPFGDGIKCESGPFVRFGTKSNVGGASRFPEVNDASISTKGHITSAGTRHYQVRFRNAAAFCTSDTFNYTSGVTVVWSL
jgi:hypothetical protein